MRGERSEQATQHRRDKARKDGDVLHSRELTAAAGTLAGVLALGVLGSRCLESWRGAGAGLLAGGGAGRWGGGGMWRAIAAGGGVLLMGGGAGGVGMWAGDGR